MPQGRISLDHLRNEYVFSMCGPQDLGNRLVLLPGACIMQTNNTMANNVCASLLTTYILCGDGMRVVADALVTSNADIPRGSSPRFVIVSWGAMLSMATEASIARVLC